jgi:two-component system, chemotaxis family, protein-glutamate methylesterase/glutaminase
MIKRKNDKPVEKKSLIKKALPGKIKAEQTKTAKSSFYIVCIGSSAGGLNAVSELLSQLPVKLNAAVFVVLHLSRAALGDILVGRIKKNTALPCSIPKDKDVIQPGHVYIAAPDAHLLIKKDRIVIGHGPAENRFRPSIDVLFRSAAASYREHAIGIVLTGFLNDGTAGMWAIKQNGGHCIVQDPNEAEYPDMPLSVLESIEVDHCVNLNKMGAIIQSIVKEIPVNKVTPSPVVEVEAQLSERIATGIKNVSSIGEKTIYACPDCGGGLWKIDNEKTYHYRCHIGHSYTEKDLNIQQAESIEHTLWVAIRMMEERKILLLKMGKEHTGKGLGKLGNDYRERAAQMDIHIGQMKELLFSISSQ